MSNPYKGKKMRSGILISLVSMWSLQMHAEAQHIRLKIESPEPKQVHFKLTAVPGFRLNLEAPWKLTWKPKADTKQAEPKHILQRSDWDAGLPGFNVKLEQPVPMEYELVTFTCNADKSQCFREVLKGEHSSPVHADSGKPANRT